MDDFSWIGPTNSSPAANWIFFSPGFSFLKKRPWAYKKHLIME
jgi:hypothetical protein